MQDEKSGMGEKEKKPAFEIELQLAGRDINQAGRDNNIIYNLPKTSAPESHTSKLKDAIKIWLKEFPKPPGSNNSPIFLSKVKECEIHPLFSDLCNHLPPSGFNVCSDWVQYKKHVSELEKIKNDLLMNLQKSITDIFPDMELRFVEFYDLMRLYDDDNYPSRLNDFECSLPSLIYKSLLFELDIDTEILETLKNREEAEEIHHNITEVYSYWNSIEDRVKSLPLSEKDNSLIWGKDNDMELIRVPRKDLNSLLQGKAKAALFVLNLSNSINDIKDLIFKKNGILEHEREQLIRELEQSLYCESFSGECRYLQPNKDLLANESATENKLEEIHSDIKSMNKKLDTAIFDLSKIKLSSGDMVTNLRVLRSELTKIAEMERGSSADLGSISRQPYPPNERQIETGNLIGAKVLELEEILKTNATTEDIQSILDELENLKPSVRFEWLGRIADLIAVLDTAIKILLM